MHGAPLFVNWRVLPSISVPNDRGRFVQADLEDLVRHFEADTGTLHLIEGGELVLQAHVGLPPAVLEIVRRVPVGKGMAGLAVLRNAPVSACDIQTDATGDVRPGARATGVGGAIVVPIRDSEGRACGALGIGVRREHDYSPAQVEALLRRADRFGESVRDDPAS